MARQKGQIRIEMMQLFLENPDKVITTQEIAAATGINKSVVSRNLTVLTEQLQITKIKAGQYQLAARVSKPKRTIADNKETIDTLLTMFDETADVFRGWVLLAVMKGDHARAKRLMEGRTQSVDVLLHRWALLNQGYDNNPEQARQDTILSKERQPSEPQTEENNEILAWDPVNKKFIE